MNPTTSPELALVIAALAGKDFTDPGNVAFGQARQQYFANPNPQNLNAFLDIAGISPATRANLSPDLTQQGTPLFSAVHGLFQQTMLSAGVGYPTQGCTEPFQVLALVAAHLK
jgi:hypothetical protein